MKRTIRYRWTLEVETYSDIPVRGWNNPIYITDGGVHMVAPIVRVTSMTTVLDGTKSKPRARGKKGGGRK